MKELKRKLHRTGMLVAAAVALPFAAAVLLDRRIPGWRYVPFGVASASLLLLYPAVSSAFAGEPVSSVYGWVPSLGIGAGFFVDAFSGLFAVVISGVGAAIFLYSLSYMMEERGEFRFYRYMLFFMGSMLGVALSGDLLLLFLFWELTSVSSFLLIGLYREEAQSIYSARKAFLVTLTGGIALLTGFVLIGEVAGTYSVPELLGSDAVRESGSYSLILALVLFGAGAKAAQFPLHIWLPDAMVAPTPVSAYLHSAAMVKAGVFLLGRLGPVLGGTPLWELLLPAVGLATMVVAGALAVRSDDLKGLLAYSTASHLGLITAMFGWGLSLGGVLHLVNHASFKSALFLVAGTVMHETGARSLKEVGGLWRSMPLTAAVAGVAALSMSGVPPFGGFVSKELFYEGALHEGPVLAAVAVLAGLLSFLYSMKFFVGTFLGSRGAESRGDPVGMALPAALLVSVTLVAGTGLGGSLFVGAAESVAPVAGEVALWHGPSVPLAMSGFTVALGLVLLAGLDSVEAGLGSLVSRTGALSPDAFYDASLDRFRSFSRSLERSVRDDGLRRRLRVLLGLTTVALLASFVEGWPPLPELTAGPSVVAVGLMIVAAAFFLPSVESHVTGTVVLGLVGFSVALLYVFAGAPDLALTQILVETLGFVLLLLVVQRLPTFYLEERRFRGGDALLSLAIGVVVLLLAGAPGRASRLSGFFLEKSVEVTGGHNVVNVILVDFRGLDTMGEITVVAIAALGAVALLREGFR